MKTKLTLFLAMIIPGILFAQSDKYQSAMVSSIDQLYNTSGVNDIEAAVNQFKRIGDAETTEWEPYYYAAFGTLMKASKIEDPGEKDEVLNTAKDILAKGKALSENNSEILAMEGYILMIQLTIDAGTRGQQLTPQIMGLFSQAMAIDPENPRAILLMAQMQMGTAQFFGTGIEQPCGLVDKAVQLFETSKPKSEIAPAWGKNNALAVQKTCAAATQDKGN